jgi:hypothetical protein
MGGCKICSAIAVIAEKFSYQLYHSRGIENGGGYNAGLEEVRRISTFQRFIYCKFRRKWPWLELRADLIACDLE